MRNLFGIQCCWKLMGKSDWHFPVNEFQFRFDFNEFQNICFNKLNNTFLEKYSAKQLTENTQQNAYNSHTRREEFPKTLHCISCALCDVWNEINAWGGEQHVTHGIRNNMQLNIYTQLASTQSWCSSCLEMWIWKKCFLAQKGKTGFLIILRKLDLCVVFFWLCEWYKFNAYLE